MRASRARSLTAPAWLVIALLLSGCLSDDGLGYEVDETEAKATRANLIKIHSRAARLAVEAVDGQGLPHDHLVNSVTCYADLGIDRFEDLRINEAFVVDETSPSQIADRIERVWRAEGWEVHRDDHPTPGLVYDTGPESLERVVGSAITYLSTNDERGRHTKVGVSALGACIDVPESFIGTGWPADVE